MADDPRWPRASRWLSPMPDPARGPAGGRAGIAVLGVPTHRTSLSATAAHSTPAAVRAALARYGTWVAGAGLDLRDLPAVDLGDVADPDGPGGEDRVRAAVGRVPDGHVLVALGGDNAATLPVASGLGVDGLVTVDAHHDLRDGRSNGSPVRRLVDEAGLAGRRIVQVGIADFANSADYAARARDLGITVVPRKALRRRPIAEVMAEALEIAGSGPLGRVHVDLDVDACDRSVAPACPASMPGGLSADELRTAARTAGRDRRVVGVDIVEVDARADSPDGRTVRLAALCLLETAAGVLERPATILPPRP